MKVWKINVNFATRRYYLHGSIVIRVHPAMGIEDKKEIERLNKLLTYYKEMYEMRTDAYLRLKRSLDLMEWQFDCYKRKRKFLFVREDL